MFACIYGPALSDSERALLVDCGCAFSPRVEETAPGTVVLDIDGLGRLLGSPQDIANAIARRASKLGLKVNVAVAQNPDAAVHAARGFAGITVIPSGEEAPLLGGLPLEVLSPPPEIAETLERWGIRTFGDFAALPEVGVSERLGPEGVRLQKLARGAGDRPIGPAIPPPVFEEAMEFEHPITLLEPLAFILARLLNQLCARLEARALATNELRLRLQFEDGSEHARVIRLPFPMRSNKAFLKLLQLDLDGNPPQRPIVAVSLSVEPVDPRVIQHGLFLPLAPEPEKLELTLARIANLVGENKVGSPELVDSHRPGAFRINRFEPLAASERSAGNGSCRHLALRVFRPPLLAKIRAESGRPGWISARGVRGKVVSLAGPWRSSGDWWAGDAWNRDEWDVALSDGALYRIYCDRQSGAWFVEGRYD